MQNKPLIRGAIPTIAVLAPWKWFMIFTVKTLYTVLPQLVIKTSSHSGMSYHPSAIVDYNGSTCEASRRKICLKNREVEQSRNFKLRCTSVVTIGDILRKSLADITSIIIKVALK